MTGARGETIIQAGDRETRLLFTNRAIAEAEDQLDRSIIGIIQGYDDGHSGIREIAALLRAGMEAARRDARAGGRPISMQTAYEILDEAGFAAVAEAVMVGVAAVLSYGTELEGELEEDGLPNA